MTALTGNFSSRVVVLVSSNWLSDYTVEPLYNGHLGDKKVAVVKRF